MDNFKLYQEIEAKFERGFIPEGIWEQIKSSIILYCVDIVVINRKRETFLLPTRLAQPMTGPWYFGGRVYTGEPDQQAASRILKREAGLEISADRFGKPIRDARYFWKAVEDGKPYDGFAHIYALELSEEEIATIRLDPKEYNPDFGIREFSWKELVAGLTCGEIHRSLIDTWLAVFGKPEFDEGIVRIGPEHVKILADFFKAMGNDEDTVKKFHPHAFNAATAKLIANYSGQEVYLAEIKDNAIVSYGLLRWSEDYPDPSLGIGVRPDFQNQGHGSKMMDALIEAACTIGAPYITLHVYKWNKSCHLYERKGFVLEQAKRDPEELKGVLVLGLGG